MTSHTLDPVTWPVRSTRFRLRPTVVTDLKATWQVSRWLTWAPATLGRYHSSPRRARADRLAGAGTRAKSMRITCAALPAADTLSNSAGALTGAGPVYTATPAIPATGGAMRIDADPVLRIAHQANVPLIEFRPTAGAGLEEMFRALAADTQGEGAAA